MDFLFLYTFYNYRRRVNGEFWKSTFNRKWRKRYIKKCHNNISENYKSILISNNRISGEDKQKYYNDLEHNVAIIEFITKCNLDKNVLWSEMEKKDK